MRILDEDNDRSLKRITLFLTADEANSLYNQLGKLLSKPKTHHLHVEDENFEREITLAIYSASDLLKFDERSRKLIEKDE
jgi:hypothetical protein